MANTHYGNLADVFKHVILAEVLAALRPAEYWESHAGHAAYDEAAEIAPERLHGIHAFHRLHGASEVLRQGALSRALGRHSTDLTRIPGSPLLARRILGDGVRRYLLCDTDAESLISIRNLLPPASGGNKELAPDTLECVQDDGVSVLRGAGMLLPEMWTGTTLALLDPYEYDGVTAAGISPLDLACELATRAVPVLLFFTFPDEGRRVLSHERMEQALGKSRLLKRGTQRFEGSLKAAPAEARTQWGFGMLAFNLPMPCLLVVDAQLQALEALYGQSNGMPEGMGGWRYMRASL